MKVTLILEFVLFFLCTIILPLYAQYPTYEARLMNFTLVAPNQLEFDIYVKRTGTIPFRAFLLQVGLIFDDAIRNGGVLSAIYVPGTSEMNNYQIPNNPNVAQVISGKRTFRLAPKIVSDSNNATIISPTGYGTRLGRFRITTTAYTFTFSYDDFTWSFQHVTYQTQFWALIPEYAIDITNPSFHLNEFPFILSGYPLPTYEATLVNDVLVSPNVYEFDIFLKRTSADAFCFNGADICLLFNSSISNGGELSSIYISGSSQMDSAQIPGNPNVSNVVGESRVWKLSIPPSLAYTLISNTANGKRLGCFRIITGSSSFTNINANLNWNFNNSIYGYSTKIYSLSWYAYPGWGGYYSATPITDSTKHFNNLSNPILPVELVSFKANVTVNKNVLLEWSTATEINNYGFEIQRKVIRQQSAVSNNEFEKIGFVAGNGISSSPKNYSFVDNRLTDGSKFAYRLKQIDNNGTFSYSSIQEVELILGEYMLSQNYPNPFNPTTTIEYIIPQAGQVILSVYNLLGEMVEELINEFKENGIYAVDLDASNLSSGSYMYVLRANGNTVSKKADYPKMILPYL